VRICAREGIPFVARGHGTGLSGGALPVAGGVVISLARMNRVVAIDLPNRQVTVEPGVTNLEITRLVAPHGYYYAPDPSSQQVCSIGGNVAENSGGAHCLKYGFTVHHVLAVDLVLPNGDLVQIGSTAPDAPGPDLLSLIIGSEGTLGIVTKITVRILRKPQTVQTLLAAYDSIREAGAAVSDIISAGIVPAAVEMMDALAIRASEAAVHPNFPPADTILIVELDGPAPEVHELFATVEQICRRAGATTVEIAADAEQRLRIWKGGKRRLRRWVACRRTTTCRMASCRDQAARRARTIASCRHGAVCRLATSSTRAMATCIPLICYDEKIPGPGAARREVAGEIPRLLRRVRRIDHRRARRGRGQEAVHGADVQRPTISTSCSACATRSTRSVCAIPGKVLPTPRLCGEVPGPVSAASRRGRRRGVSASDAVGEHRRQAPPATSQIETPDTPEKLAGRARRGVARAAVDDVSGAGTKLDGGALQRPSTAASKRRD
jgi:glycolate oxidase